MSITFYIVEHYQLWMMDSKAQRVFFPKTPKLCVWHTEVRSCYHFKLVSHFQLWFPIWALVNRLKSQITAQNKPTTALHQQQTKQQHRNCRAVSNHQQTPAKEKLQPMSYRFDVSQHIQNHRSSCSENPSVQSFSLERVRVDPYSALHLLNSSHRSVRASLHNPKSTQSSIHEQDFFCWLNCSGLKTNQSRRSWVRNNLWRVNHPLHLHLEVYFDRPKNLQWKVSCSIWRSFWIKKVWWIYGQQKNVCSHTHPLPFFPASSPHKTGALILT